MSDEKRSKCLVVGSKIPHPWVSPISRCLKLLPVYQNIGKISYQCITKGDNTIHDTPVTIETDQ